MTLSSSVYGTLTSASRPQRVRKTLYVYVFETDAHNISHCCIKLLLTNARNRQSDKVSHAHGTSLRLFTSIFSKPYPVSRKLLLVDQTRFGHTDSSVCTINCNILPLIDFLGMSFSLMII